jgi:hypothetical protein
MSGVESLDYTARVLLSYDMSMREQTFDSFGFMVLLTTGADLSV